MVKSLLLEIGAEEIPAGFLRNASANLKNLASSKFSDHNLTYSVIEVFYTPRRLVLKVDGMPEMQSDAVLNITGPPKRISYDENGNPTNAALGFARKQNVKISEITVIENEKGEFLAIKKITKGKKSSQILKQVLPEIILSIPFPRSMRWLDEPITFARPIRWIMCLFGDKKLNININGIRSTDKTTGHRFLKPGKLRVSSWKEYTDKLRQSYVIIDQEERKNIINTAVSQRSRNLNGKIFPDDELLETVTNIVEYPCVLTGGFSKDFLEIPQEVLVSVMKSHQKYFPLYKNNSSQTADTGIRTLQDIKNNNCLLPKFVFVSGIKVDDPSKIISGNEKVIKARFSDARFFLEEDTKKPLVYNNEKLKLVTFLSEIGNYYEKILRLQKTAQYLSAGLKPRDREVLERAALLSKADLVSQMVFEFPELQGVIGKYYSLLSGEKPEVAAALEEQYMPLTRDGELPGSICGAYLSIMDKIDNICSCFCAGLIPSGTADPYALRRQSIGILNILIKHGLNLKLPELVKFNLSLLRSDESLVLNLTSQVLNFIRERCRNLLTEMDFSYDLVDAVISVNFDDVIETKKIVEVLYEFRKNDDFESVATAFKRVVNIVGDTEKGEINKTLLNEPAEKSLYEEYRNLADYVEQGGNSRDYRELIQKFIHIKNPVDNFFDQVLVMDKNSDIKNNRLQLLLGIKMLFFRMADFSKLN